MSEIEQNKSLCQYAFFKGHNRLLAANLIKRNEYIPYYTVKVPKLCTIFHFYHRINHKNSISFYTSTLLYKKVRFVWRNLIFGDKGTDNYQNKCNFRPKKCLTQHFYVLKSVLA